MVVRFHDGEERCYALENVVEADVGFLPEFFKKKRVIVTTDNDDTFLVDNSELQSQSLGLPYYIHRDLRAQDPRQGAYAAWGSVVEGVLENGWFRFAGTSDPSSCFDAEDTKSGTRMVSHTTWSYSPYNGKKMFIRKSPSHDAEKIDNVIMPGETFVVCEERHVHGTTFLRLADGRGWTFNRSPGGIMCQKVNEF